MKSKKRLNLVLSSVFIILALFNYAYAGNDKILGQNAENKGKFKTAITHYTKALQSLKNGSNEDFSLRKKIIKLSKKLQSSLVVSKKVQRYMARGEVAIESANNIDDYIEAEKEFKKALKLAPWYIDGYYNLGLVQDRAGKYNQAIKNLKLYLFATPNDKKVQYLIYKIEYRAEKAERNRIAEINKILEKQKEAELVNQFSGTWRHFMHSMTLEVSSSNCTVLQSGPGHKLGRYESHQILQVKWCKIIENKLQVNLYGYDSDPKYGFSYSVVCEYSLNLEKNELIYESGGDKDSRYNTCNANKFKRIN